MLYEAVFCRKGNKMKKKAIIKSSYGEHSAVYENPSAAQEGASSGIDEGAFSHGLLNATSSFFISEAYKAARTNLSFLLTGEAGKNIACFTSPSPGEGKTTTCANIAITFAQTDAKVLMIDADLRKPKLHKIFALSAQPGLTNLLSGFSDYSEVIRKTDYPNLDLLTAGHVPPNPAELLSSPQMKAILEQFSAKYDYIFIDTPPINVVTDVAALSKYATGIILVARQGITTTDTMKKAVESLRFVGANVLGFILNDINKDKYSYNYRYRYKYRYKQ